MGIRKHGLRVYVDVPELKTASLSTSGLSKQEQREAQYIAAVDGSGLGVVLKDPTGPTGIIMPILELTDEMAATIEDVCKRIVADKVRHWETMEQPTRRGEG